MDKLIVKRAGIIYTGRNLPPLVSRKREQLQWLSTRTPWAEPLMVSPCSECLLTPRESDNTDTHQLVFQIVHKRKQKAQRGNARGKKQQLSREAACMQSHRQGCEDPHQCLLGHAGRKELLHDHVVPKGSQQWSKLWALHYACEVRNRSWAVHLELLKKWDLPDN